MELDLDVWTAIMAELEDEETLEQLAEGQVAHDTADTPGSRHAEAKRLAADHAHRQELLANISYQMNVFENQIFMAR